MVDFEQCFSDFLERPEYDRAEAELFTIVRAAFQAGWLAAGGKPLPPQKVVALAPPARKRGDKRNK